MRDPRFRAILEERKRLLRETYARQPGFIRAVVEDLHVASFHRG